MKITIYSKNNCKPCTLTKQWLNTRNIEYSQRNISKDGKYIQEVHALGYNALPVIVVYKDGEKTTWDGFREDLLAEHIN
jgi:glutaredoxin-like protein NrdH